MRVYATTADVTATQTTFTDEHGQIIGRMWEIETGAGPAFVAEAHDWTNGRGEYVPQLVNTYSDNADAQHVITVRAELAGDAA